MSKKTGQSKKLIKSIKKLSERELVQKRHKNRTKKLGLILIIAIIGVIGGVKLFQRNIPIHGSTIVKPGDFWLTATNVWSTDDKKNYADLKWKKLSPLNAGGYTLYQSEVGNTNWEKKSTMYGKGIKVLGVYPDVPASNTLKSWMDSLNLKDKYGQKLIDVVPVSLMNYGQNPDKYLKNAQGEYIYDAIMFGTWDYNAHLDITPLGAQKTKAYLDTGRGVLFGHDTITPNDGSHNNFNTFAPAFGLHLRAGYNQIGSRKVKVMNDGYMMKYPFELGNAVELNIPLAHSWGQAIKPNSGITKWLEFMPPSNWNRPVEGGDANHYLITKNNMGMIQTGHSDSSSTMDERKIIANTLYNLAQVTVDAEADDHTVKDTVAPEVPTVTSQPNGTINHLAITIKSKDIGKWYQWYVEADTRYSGIKKSDVVKEEIISDMAGYIYTIDNNSNTNPEVKRDGFGHVTNINLPVTLPNTEKVVTVNPSETETQYLHVVAVDRSHNVSAVKHIQIRALMSEFKVTERYFFEEDVSKTEPLKGDTSVIITKNKPYSVTDDKLFLGEKYELKEIIVDGTTIAASGVAGQQLISQVNKSQNVDFIYKKKIAKVTVNFLDDNNPATSLLTPIVLVGQYDDRINLANNDQVKQAIEEVERITINNSGYELKIRPVDETNVLLDQVQLSRAYIFEEIPNLHGYWINIVIENKQLIVHYKNIDRIKIKLDGAFYKEYPVTKIAAEQQLALDIPVNSFRNVVTADGYVNTIDTKVVESTYNSSKLPK